MNIFSSLFEIINSYAILNINYSFTFILFNFYSNINQSRIFGLYFSCKIYIDCICKIYIYKAFTV